MTRASETRINTIFRTIKSGVITLLLCVTNVALAQNELVGSDGGSVSVGNSGQAVWSMPVEVPSGINGVAPNLVLSVSSNGGNGSLGVGGNLSGLSTVSRCGRTLYQDGYFQAPQYKQNDAYCLDGARLVLESGTYGADGSIYRTEIESFQRIKAFGAVAGKGPAYFEVTNRAGAKMIYGQSAGTNEVDPHSGAVSIWKIDQLIDSNSNTLHYHYGDVSGSNEVQLTSVSYGGNTTQNVAEHLFVELVYEDRPDKTTAWSRGQQYSQTKRIFKIKTLVDSTIVKKYKLTYEQGTVTGASRLSSVQECAGNGDCYRPSTFEYAPETQTNWTAATLSLPSQLQTSDGKPLGTITDINNDGKADWVSANIDVAGVSSITTYVGDLSGWQESTNFNLPGALFDYSQNDDGFAKGMLLDVNGDGWPDYVQAYQTTSGQTIQTWRNTGATFERDSSLDLPVPLSSLEADGSVRSMADVADLNADGLVDIVVSVNINGTPVRQTWMHEENNGVHSWQVNAAYQAPTIAIDYTQGTDGRVLAVMQDVNSDGLSDWVQSYKLNGNLFNATWLNTGEGWLASAEYELPVGMFDYDITTKGFLKYNFIDINSDGLLDLVKAINMHKIGLGSEFDTWLNNGVGWQQDISYNLPRAPFELSFGGDHFTSGGLMDINGDGYLDIVMSLSWDVVETTGQVEEYYLYEPDSKQWLLSNDYSFPFINFQLISDNNQISGVWSSFSTAEVADLNHDGFPELLNTLTGDVYTSLSGNSNIYPGTLIGTTNSLGGQTELEYGISTDPTLYELAEQTPYPNVAYNAPVRVIKEISVSNGIGGMISAQHSYGKAKTNVQGQGGLGYEYHLLKDVNSGVEVTTTFHQSYPFAGKLKSSTKSLDGILFSTSDSEMELLTISINGLDTTYAHPSSSLSHSYDLNGNLIKITRSTSEIDNFGNSTVITNEIYDATDTLVRRSTKTVVYKAEDLTRWLFGLPIRTTQTSFDQATGETYTNVSTAEFEDDGKPKKETLEPDHSKWVSKRYEYDGFGNRTINAVSASGIAERVTTTTYTTDGRFPETVTNTLGHTITTEFDPILSKPNFVMDPNGITKEFLYDGFGTTIRETKSHQSNGAIRGKQVVIPKWCDDENTVNCPVNAVYFIAAFDDEGEAPEIAYYDINGKELRKQTYGFDGKLIVVETEYDENGKVARFSQPYFLETETAHWTSYEYDEIGRQIERKNAAGDYFYTAYNGLEVFTTNPGNNNTGAQVSRVFNNIFGQPISSEDPDHNITTYKYDGRGKLVETKDAKNNIAKITYDDTFGRKIAMDDPDLGKWTYEYDSLGNLIAQTDAELQRTTLVYDELNRLVSRTDDDGGSKEETTTWTFSNNSSNGNIIGGLEKVETNNFLRTVKYDEYSRINEATTVIEGNSFSQKTGYLGTQDKVDWIEYPSGLTVRNTYDDYGFPQTVEGISLDHAKYAEFQAASKILNDKQRELEAWKNEYLTDQNLSDLETHESEVRRLGKALGEFYDEFADNQDKKATTDVAQRYTNLIEKVQKKIEQHDNWLNIYQQQYDTHYTNIKPDLERLDELVELSKIQEIIYEEAETKRDNYASKAQDYADLINPQVAIINTNVQKMNNNRIHVNNLIQSLYHEPNASRYEITEDFDTTGLEAMYYDIECCAYFVITTFMKTTNDALITSHFDQIANYYGLFVDAASKAATAQQKITNGNWEWWFDHWDTRRGEQEGYMTKANNKIITYSNEANAINTTIKPDLDRINDWLSPIIQSHSNIILSYNDRARVFITEISKQTGSYAKRDDLKADNFLKPFDNHIEYIRCLRDESNKSTGDCYAEHLVHVYDDDGNVDATKQAEARADIEDATRIDVKQFWSTNRFFCGYYYGYSCADVFNQEIKELAKTIQTRQCARMTDQEKDALLENNSAPCDTSLWNTTAKVNAGESPFVFPYLESSVVAITNLNGYKSDLDNDHKNVVANLVTEATLNTYNAETNYDDIVNGVVWQSNPDQDTSNDKADSREQECIDWAPAAIAEEQPVCTAWQDKEIVADDDQSDPADFVLIKKGDVQDLAYALMDNVQRAAEEKLKGHQYAIEQIINAGQDGQYAALYLAVQNQAIIVNRLYDEMDTLYANAEYIDDYEQGRKIYWQAEDINSKGQIAKAKYGNGTVTDWTYDQFGRINSHITKKKDTATDNWTSIVSNSYQYDAIGNLTHREDVIEQVFEDYTYDNMNRLIQVDMSGSGTDFVKLVDGNVIKYDYDEIGNLIYKSDVYGGGIGTENYTYGLASSGQHAGPHAVTYIEGMGGFTYDNNGNQLTGNGRTNQYSAFNKPTLINRNGKDTQMWYGPERQLIKQLEDTDNGQETTVYIGGLYEQISNSGSVINRHNISVAGNVIAVVDTAPNSNVLIPLKEHYLHKNHQSSVLAITDINGDVVERRYYDAFGDLNSNVGSATAVYASGIAYDVVTDMSFTSHKWLQSAGVVHMKGRVYDPFVGRFMSADPHIQSPLNSQSLNRYSYVHNNPLSFTDPSGYFLGGLFKALKKLFKKIKKIIKKINLIVKAFKAKYKFVKKVWAKVKKYARVIIAVIVAVAIVYFTAGAGAGYGVALAGGGTSASAGLGLTVAAGAAAGAASGLIMTGSLKGMLEGAFFGAITAGFAHAVSTGVQAGKGVFAGLKQAAGSGINFAHRITQVIGHGVIGGLRSLRAGGKFLAGFVTGAVGKLVTFGTDAINSLAKNPFIQGLVVATAGGLTSVLAGGSFELGFITAGLAFATNAILEKQMGPPKPRPDDLSVHGNYSGKGHLGQELEPNPGESSYSPIDALDEAARAHDQGYYDNGIEFNGIVHSDPIRRQIDQNFIDAVNSIDTLTLGFGDRIYIDTINFIFGDRFYVPPIESVNTPFNYDTSYECLVHGCI